MPVNPLQLYHGGSGGSAQDPTFEDWDLRRKLAAALGKDSLETDGIKHWTQGAAKLTRAAVATYLQHQLKQEQEKARAESAKLFGSLIPKPAMADAARPAGPPPIDMAPGADGSFSMRPHIAAALPQPGVGFGAQPDLAYDVETPEPEMDLGAGRFAMPGLGEGSTNELLEPEPQIEATFQGLESEAGLEPITQDRVDAGQAVMSPMRQQLAAALSPQHMDAIKKFEGYTPRATWDYKQHSIGYGTKARHPGEVIDRPEAESRLNDEVAKARAIVDQHVPGDAPEGVKAALTSLTYNAGSKWTRSGLGEAVRAGDYQKAQELFLQYNKAGGKVLPGLASRRQSEAQWMTGGQGEENAPGVRTAEAGEPDWQAMLKNPYTAPLARQMILEQYKRRQVEGGEEHQLKLENMRQRNQYLRSRSGAVEANAETKRLAVYEKLLGRFGQGKIDPRQWDAENQPGGLIYTAAGGMPIPFKDAQGFLQRVQMKSQGGPDAQQLLNEGFTPEQVQSMQRNKRIEEQMGPPKRGFVWDFDKAGRPVQKRMASDGKSSISDEMKSAIKEYTSRLSAAEKVLLDSSVAKNFFGRPPPSDGSTSFTSGIGESGRAFEDYEQATLGAVYAMSGKQTTNKEMERFLRINQPKWNDNNTTIKVRTERIRGVLNAISRGMEGGLSYDDAERAALSGGSKQNEVDRQREQDRRDNEQRLKGRNGWGPIERVR